MQLQPEFFLHVTSEVAGGAGPLLAKMALSLESRAGLQVSLASIKRINDFRRDPSYCGLNEFFAVELVRAAIMGDLAPWDDEEIAQLLAVASRPEEPTLSDLFPYSTI